MTEKKSYSPPQLVRVELNHEQAILSVCSTTATNLKAGTTQTCQSGKCKNKGGGGGNLAGRPS
jgi:hypothetical protein